MNSEERQKRLREILPYPADRDEERLRMECLRLGYEMERRFFGNRLGRRLAVLDHARAFVDFVRHNESKEE